MPITATEWEEGRLDPGEQKPEPTPVETHPDARETVEAFFRTNPDFAFTRAEVVRAAGSSRTLEPKQLGTLLARLPNQLADLATDFADGGLPVEAYSNAVDTLVASGRVQCARVERLDDEPVVYYRLAKAVDGTCRDDDRTDSC